MNEELNPIDEEIALKVMGLGLVSLSNPALIPRYSTQVAPAMVVFDRMRELGHRWLLNADEVGFHLRHVASVTHDLDRDEKRYQVDRPLGSAKTLEELPKVICEAALREIKGSKSV